MSGKPWYTLTVVLDEDQDPIIAGNLLDSARASIKNVYLDYAEVHITMGTDAENRERR